MSKSTGIIIGIMILAFGGLVTWALIDKSKSAIDYDRYDLNGVIAATEDNGEIGDHIKGDENAEVFIIEYADFQCPGCSASNTRVNKVVEEYEGRVAVIYRNFLMSYHQNGLAAASAAEAAGLQGKWKEMADALFMNQAAWETLGENTRGDAFLEIFMGLDTGLDGEKFLEDMGSAQVRKKIDFDQAIAKKIKAPGTPAFYIDGEQISTGSDEESFMQNMRTAINKKLNK